MAITAPCPNCGNEKAQYLTLENNNTISIDCGPAQGCDFQAAVTVRKALETIPDEKFPLQLSE